MQCHWRPCPQPLPKRSRSAAHRAGFKVQGLGHPCFSQELHVQLPLIETSRGFVFWSILTSIQYNLQSFVSDFIDCIQSVGCKLFFQKHVHRNGGHSHRADRFYTFTVKSRVQKRSFAKNVQKAAKPRMQALTLTTFQHTCMESSRHEWGT